MIGPRTYPAGRIIFNSNRGGNHEIYSMATDGGDVRRVTTDPTADAYWGRVSPDRRSLLFHRVPAGIHNKPEDYFKTSLWTMRAGRAPVQIVANGANGWTIFGHAEWSPDSRRIALFAAVGFTPPQLWTIDAAGGTPRQITKGGLCLDPAWSPDGTKIVYAGSLTAPGTSEQYEILEVPASGGVPRRLTGDSLRDHDPYYSPDGSTIAFLTQTAPADPAHPAGSWNIRLMNADGTNLRWLTSDANVNSKPAWSPDGKTIYFHRLVYGSGGFQIWKIDVASRAMRQLTFGPGISEYPS